MTARPYQADCVSACFESWNKFRKILAVLPTGAGKSPIFSWVAERAKKTLIIAHRDELIEQAIDKLKRFTGLVADKEKADSFASLESRVVVASIQTLCSRPERWPANHFSHIVIDEAHRTLGESYLGFLNRHPESKILGVTATPDRADKQELGSFYEEVAYETTLIEMIRQGYLSKIRVRQVPLKIDVSKVRASGSDFNDADLDSALDPYLVDISNHIPRDRKVIVFLPLVSTSIKFADICRWNGLDVEHIDGTSPNRKEILTRFSQKRYGVLCNSALLTEGYDEPGIDCVVPLRPTTSRGLYSQIIGRGTRIAEGKDHLLVLDFLWLTGKHSLVRPSSLVAGSREIAEIADKLTEESGEVDLLEASESALLVREESLRRELEKQAKALKFRKPATMIDPVEWALDLGDSMLAEYQPTMDWHRKPATDGQIAMLKKFKVDTERVSCRGHANSIINRIMDRSKLKLATPRQLVWLKRRGHPSPATCTFKDAQVFLENVFRKGK